jgi:hypothetical protein
MTQPTTALPPRTTTVPRDIAAEIIDEYSPELAAAYRAARDNGELWQYADVALAAYMIKDMRTAAGR